MCYSYNHGCHNDMVCMQSSGYYNCCIVRMDAMYGLNILFVITNSKWNRGHVRRDLCAGEEVFLPRYVSRYSLTIMMMMME